MSEHRGHLFLIERTFVAARRGHCRTARTLAQPGLAGVLQASLTGTVPMSVRPGGADAGQPGLTRRAR